MDIEWDCEGTAPDEDSSHSENLAAQRAYRRAQYLKDKAKKQESNLQARTDAKKAKEEAYRSKIAAKGRLDLGQFRKASELPVEQSPEEKDLDP